MSSRVITDVGRWRTTIAETFVEFEVDEVGAEFHGAVEPVDLGRGISLTGVSTERSHVVRTPTLAKDGRDDALFLIHRAGPCSVAVGSHRRSLRPGDGTIHCADVPYSLTFTGDARVLVLTVPRTLVRNSASYFDDETGPVVPTSPAMTMLTSLAEETRRQGDSLDSAVREELGHTALELLAAAVKPGREGTTSESSGRTIILTLRRALQAHATDPQFGIADAAAMAHVSLRYAQKLFAADGLSMSGFLRTHRLRHAARLLGDRDGRTSVEAVAHLSGFSEVNTFIRAFAREYGQTPARWRTDRLADRATVS
jgi:AraC-like DNA-binding protein